MKYNYHAFGLNIQSEIELPELLTAKNNYTDIQIRFGKVPNKLEQCETTGFCFQIGRSAFLLKKENTANYIALDGKQVIIEKKGHALNEDIRLFLLTTVFGALFQQRDLLPLHASAVRSGDKCILFCGASGSGKSTLIRALMKKGYDLISDDVCVISENGQGHPIVHPGYPMLKLWKDALSKLDEDAASLTRVRQVVHKYFVPAQNQYHEHPLKIKNIYILRPWNQKEIQVSRINGGRKFNLLKKMTYRLKFSKALGKEGDQFKLLGLIGNRVPLAEIKRPQKPFMLDELVTLIEKNSKEEPDDE